MVFPWSVPVERCLSCPNPTSPHWFKTTWDVADIRIPTCFKTRILLPIGFSKGLGFQGHCLLSNACWYFVLTTPKSDVFSVLCRAGYVDSNYGEVRDAIKQRLYAYSFLTDALWNNPMSFLCSGIQFGTYFCIILILGANMWRPHNTFNIFFISFTQIRSAKNYTRVHA